MQLLTLGDADLDLGHATMVKIHHKRHKRHPLALGLVPHVGQLLAAHQQFAAAALSLSKIGQAAGAAPAAFLHARRPVGKVSHDLAPLRGAELRPAANFLN